MRRAMAQDQLREPQPARRTRGRAPAHSRSYLSHAEPKFTRLSRQCHPVTPKGATRPIAVETYSNHLNCYVLRLSGADVIKQRRYPQLIDALPLKALDKPVFESYKPYSFMGSTRATPS